MVAFGITAQSDFTANGMKLGNGTPTHKMANLDSRGIKNKFLVDKLGVSTGAVSKWCSNQSQPRVEMLFRIAKVLEVDVCELLNKDAEVG